MYCISMNHNHAPLTVRQQFAYSEKEQRHLLEELVGHHLIDGGVLLATCGRCELYFTKAGEVPREAIEQRMAAEKSVEIGLLKRYSYFYDDRKAFIHLGRVVCGMDSVLLGEDEIFHQTKEAYEHAKSWQVNSEEINISFQAAFHIARESKRCTRLKETPVSIGTLTANYIEQYLATHPELPKTVLVIGATGKIGSIVVSDLLAKGIPVIGTIRTHGNPGIAQGELDDAHMTWIPFELRYDNLLSVGAVVSATASPHYTLLECEYIGHIKQQEKLLIDLAVPYDIDRAIGNLPGHTLLDVEDIQDMAKKNYEIKQQEVQQVEALILAGVEETQKKLYVHDFMKKLSDREEPWFLPMVYYLKSVLDSDLLLEVLTQIEEKELM